MRNLAVVRTESNSPSVQPLTIRVPLVRVPFVHSLVLTAAMRLLLLMSTGPHHTTSYGTLASRLSVCLSVCLSLA